MAKKDFYSTLGVPRGAPQKEIRQVYRRLARQYHPDVNPGDAAAEARFKEINAAYEVLSDEGKRKKYDKYGDQWEHADQIEEMQRQSGGRTFRFGNGGVNFDLGDLGGADLGSMFESFFGGRGRGPQRSRSVEQRIDVTLQEAFHGGARTLQLATEQPCPTCGGSGQIASAVCHVCQGRGLSTKTRTIEMKIPAGVDDGSRIRIAGEGQMGGDLYLVVAMKPDARFERKGADLYTTIELPVTDAVLGTEVEAPTITGKVMLKVPPLTQNGRRFRLAKQGMPKLNSSDRGDLYVRIEVKLPEQLGEREKELYEELRSAGV